MPPLLQGIDHVHVYVINQEATICGITNYVL